MDAPNNNSAPDEPAGFAQVPDRTAETGDGSSSAVIVKRVKRSPVTDILPLRHAVLRPGLPLPTAKWTGDNNPTTRHYAALDHANRVIGCATVLLNEYKGKPALQLRGMAVDNNLAKRGVGSAVLRFLHHDLFHEPHQVTSKPVALIWANARKHAIPFYLKHGYTIDSNEFDIKGVGPHHIITIDLAG